ncbi:hypothetical protein, partial [Salmonella sp. s54395]|uniref:hypothetical protein n=1 Tax=Salmonella sp. s54395 TaxID=3159664 RepID=UPI003980DCEA
TGQGGMAHILSCRLCPWQVRPPLSGRGALQARMRVSVPLPQDMLHVHGVQLLQPPSRTFIHCWLLHALVWMSGPSQAT